MRSWAFLIFDAATISIALVIFCVFWMLLICVRISLPEAMRLAPFRQPSSGSPRRYQLPVFLNASMPFLNAASMFSFQSPDSLT